MYEMADSRTAAHNEWRQQLPDQLAFPLSGPPVLLIRGGAKGVRWHLPPVWQVWSIRLQDDPPTANTSHDIE